MRIEFYRHNISQKDIGNAVDVLKSLFLTHGEVVDEFERRFSRYTGCKYTIGVNSCTAALHVSLLAFGIGPGDEVITTPLTFIATANAVLHAGATPVFIDVEPETGNLNAGLIEAAITSRTKAILPVHLYGQMCDMKTIREIADRRGLAVIEDSAHCVEGQRDGIRPGMLGDAACFSFYATKSITSGEGGAVVTNNEKAAEIMRKLRLHGMSKGASERYSKKYEHWDMEMLGWKYNMNNIQAALLLDQLKHIDKLWQKREDICRRYEEAFKGNAGVTCLQILPSSKSGRHLFTILVPPDRRDLVLHRLQEKGIGVAVNYRAIHLLTYYRDRYRLARGMFPEAERIGDSTITLPLYTKLREAEIEYIIKSVKGTTTT
ncbi:MAG: DegT/DnrJ/EryC1/StrS family aminotransferase [Dehalococcoidia bacterium]